MAKLRKNLSMRGRILLALGLVTLFLSGLATFFYLFLPTPLVLFVSLTGFGVLLCPFLVSWILFPHRQTLKILDSGLRSFNDNDFSVRLAPPPEPDLAKLVSFFNDLLEASRHEKQTIYQKELLLDTVIQGAPTALLLFGPTDRLVLANRAGRMLFPMDPPFLGRHLREVLERAEPSFRDAVEQGKDALITLQTEDGPETFHLAIRLFRISTRTHRLLQVKHLTRELQRQEVQTWKKIIRLINHELNNTLAPLRSLLHSARLILDQGLETHKLDRIFQTMSETTFHLQRFLENYASFARLPVPVKRVESWRVFFERLRTLTPFDLSLNLQQEAGLFDPDQLQQVILNLVKNGVEASDDHKPVAIEVDQLHDGTTVIKVMDRGKGMSEEAMNRALLPFFSTKKRGTGLGLALCREILESHGGTIGLQRRSGGGVEVICRLPPR